MLNAFPTTRIRTPKRHIYIYARRSRSGIQKNTSPGRKINCTIGILSYVYICLDSQPSFSSISCDSNTLRIYKYDMLFLHILRPQKDDNCCILNTNDLNPSFYRVRAHKKYLRSELWLSPFRSRRLCVLFLKTSIYIINYYFFYYIFIYIFLGIPVESPTKM